MDKASVFEIADKFFSAIENADLAIVEDLYADDIVVWHSNSPLAQRSTGQTKSENLKLLRYVCELIDNLTYDILDRQLTETGFVQQHVFCGRSKGGQDIAMPVAIIFEIRDGQISRIDEYFDPSQFPSQ